MDSIFGTTTKESAVKKGYKLPRAQMANADLARLINSDEIQTVLRAPKSSTGRHAPLKKNPLKNLGAMLKLNPYAKVARRIAATSSTKNAAKRAAKLAQLAAGKAVGPKKSAEVKKVRRSVYVTIVFGDASHGFVVQSFDSMYVRPQHGQQVHATGCVTGSQRKRW